ncbi:hypothetical protein CPB83DRAFT_571714 [Crepidotus variabilis]|uniref:Pinin/SDK/MemA protein domain-containing protein n=1 Tax=Crepidotus variabilis TaxID=179855 RepID=A0A9P6E9X9_9AGAR|nr:hypothetical protein CPB83DRAFT_571714 [Crepidotus variabilis]
MSAEDAPKDNPQVEASEPPKSPTELTETKKRPRLDVSSLAGARDRKRGKSMFGILVGTLNKAKIEDKERNASDAAKKRHLIDQRLQAKLRKETDSVRRAEEVKKDKTVANRKEEDLQLKDSIYKLRRKRLPVLSNFLVTSDVIPDDDDGTPTSPSTKTLDAPPRSHPPPLYYIPAILTPAQERYLSQRKAKVSLPGLAMINYVAHLSLQVAEATETEWGHFVEERKAGIEEINSLRQRVADEAAKSKTGDREGQGEMEMDGPRGELPSPTSAEAAVPSSEDVEMEVDSSTPKGEAKNTSAAEPEKKGETSAMQADDDEAVEY